MATLAAGDLGVHPVGAVRRDPRRRDVALGMGTGGGESMENSGVGQRAKSRSLPGLVNKQKTMENHHAINW